MIDAATRRRAALEHERSPTRANVLSTVVWLVPCGIAAVYMVEWVARFSANVTSISWISDYAFALLAPRELVTSGMGGHMNLGTYGSYASLWFGMLTAKLPLHTYLWQIAPTALFIAAVLLVAWSVAQIADRRAAIFAVLLAIVSSPIAWGTFMPPAVHNTTYTCTAMLGAFLVWLTKAEGYRQTTAIAVALFVAVASGISLASDALLIPTALAPFALTAIVAWLGQGSHNRRVAIFALAALFVALPVAWLTSKIMSSLGYETEAQRLGLTALSLLPQHLSLLSLGLKALFNGYLTLVPSTFHIALGIACDAIGLFCLLALLLAAGRSTYSVVVRTHRTKDGGSEHTSRNGTHVRLTRDLHVVYWVSSGLMACGAYLLSEFYDSEHVPFYATTVLSIAAVIPLFLRSRWRTRWSIPIGASIFFAASLVGLLQTRIVPQNTLLMNYQAAVLRLAHSNHVTVGYASYEDASSLTWNSGERVTVRPVYSCPGEEERALCRAPHDTMESWYVPKPRRTFLLMEEPNFYPSTAVVALPKGLGRPIAGYQIGPIKMFIYSYDIASRVRHIS